MLACVVPVVKFKLTLVPLGISAKAACLPNHKSVVEVLDKKNCSFLAPACWTQQLGCTADRSRQKMKGTWCFKEGPQTII
jgi:hypothetical protein